MAVEERVMLRTGVSFMNWKQQEINKPTSTINRTDDGLDHGHNGSHPSLRISQLGLDGLLLADRML